MQIENHTHRIWTAVRRYACVDAPPADACTWMLLYIPYTWTVAPLCAISRGNSRIKWNVIKITFNFRNFKVSSVFCFTKCVRCVKCRGHWLHEYGLILLWTLVCAIHWDFRRNSRPHISHLNGFNWIEQTKNKSKITQKLHMNEKVKRNCIETLPFLRYARAYAALDWWPGQMIYHIRRICKVGHWGERAYGRDSWNFVRMLFHRSIWMDDFHCECSYVFCSCPNDWRVSHKLSSNNSSHRNEPIVNATWGVDLAQTFVCKWKGKE